MYGGCVRSVVVIISVLCVLLIGGIGLSWYGVGHGWFHTSTNAAAQSVPNITVIYRAIDADTHQPVSGTFDVTDDNTTSVVLRHGTFTSGYNTFVLPGNGTYDFYLRGTEHYTSLRIKQVFRNDTASDIVLYKFPQTIDINGSTVLASDTNVTLPVVVTTPRDTHLRTPILCVAWTFGVQHVSVLGLQPAPAPSRLLRTTDACFTDVSTQTIGNGGETYMLSIATGAITPADSITLTIVDQDAILPDWEPHAETPDGQDLGAPDVTSVIATGVA